MWFIEILKAILIGIVEGITEWLPISSTGHMILLEKPLELAVSEDFMDLFLMVIQLGAIIAVPILFWNKLNPFSKTKTKEERKNTIGIWKKVIVGIIPAGVAKVLLKVIEEILGYEPIDEKSEILISSALILYGVAFIVVERFKKVRNNEFRVLTVDDLTYNDALCMGLFQVLSIIPGTSRSGSTILGGMLTGVSRSAAAEFSFFMAIPIMIGASLLEIVEFVLKGISATPSEIAILFVGMAVAFLVSYVVIKFLMDFVKRHSFTVFGVYRIILGVAGLIYFALSI